MADLIDGDYALRGPIEGYALTLASDSNIDTPDSGLAAGADAQLSRLAQAVERAERAAARLENRHRLLQREAHAVVVELGDIISALSGKD